MHRTLLITIFTIVAATACSSRSGGPNAVLASMSGGTSPAKMTWVTYTDPSEHSFSIEVPQGWTVGGGMYRFGYFDVRATVDLRSPDGNIILRFDDANVPPYALPGPYKPAEGHPYNKPYQYQMMVERYRDAASFADTYARSRFKSVCQTMTQQASNWKPVLPSIMGQMHPDQTSDAAVDYACATTAGAKLASIFVHTSLYRQSGFWQADPVLSAITVPALMPVAQGVLQHALDSFQINPQWQAHQQQMTQEGLAMIQRDFETFLAQTRATMQNYANSMNQQVAGFEAHQHASAEQSHEWGNILTGIADARDPYTGEQFQVWTGPNANYYRNGLGNTVNSNSSPGAGYYQVPVQQ